MDRSAAHRERRLLERLGQRRMGMADAADVLRRRAVVHRRGRLAEQVAGGRTVDVHAVHAVVSGCQLNSTQRPMIGRTAR